MLLSINNLRNSDYAEEFNYFRQNYSLQLPILYTIPVNVYRISLIGKCCERD